MGMAEYDHLNILKHAGDIHSLMGHDKFDPSDFKPVHLTKSPRPSPVIISPYRVQGLVHIQLMIQHLIVKVPRMDNHIAGFQNPFHLRPEHSMGVCHDCHPYRSRFHYIIPPDTARPSKFHCRRLSYLISYLYLLYAKCRICRVESDRI